MTSIVVCPLSKLSDTVARSGARQVVSLINAGTPVPLPPGVDAADHLFIGIHDISEPAEGMVCPGEDHMGELLAFVRRWDRSAPLVVHCYAGISRSTAAAYSALCALRPDLDEGEIAQRLRRRSPEATPNARLVEIADALLGRDGRMSRAVERIGRGVEAFEGSVFALSLDE